MRLSSNRTKFLAKQHGHLLPDEPARARAEPEPQPTADRRSRRGRRRPGRTAPPQPPVDSSSVVRHARRADHRHPRRPHQRPTTQHRPGPAKLLFTHIEQACQVHHISYHNFTTSTLPVYRTATKGHHALARAPGGLAANAEASDRQPPSNRWTASRLPPRPRRSLGMKSSNSNLQAETKLFFYHYDTYHH